MKEKKKMSTENRILLGIAVIFGIAVVMVMSGAAAFVVHGGLAGIAARSGEGEARQRVQLSSTNTTTKVTDGGIYDLSPIVDKVMPSIVAITSTMTSTYYNFFGAYDQDTEGSGSGVIFDMTDDELLIMTNNHVVNEAKAIQISFNNGALAEGYLKGNDSSTDLAVVGVKLADLEQETRDAIQVAELGDSDELKVGQMVLAIGNALGYGQALTVGYVSAKDREIYVDGLAMILLQTDAAINPGNSGGALLNIDGQVVGINSVKLTDEAVEGMGYAIPMAIAQPILEDLKDREIVDIEERGYMGIYYEEVTEEANVRYQVPRGIRVSRLVDGGAAEKAGVLQGDVITEVEGREIRGADDLQEILKFYRAGDTVAVTLQRYAGGKYKEIELTLTLTKQLE